MSYGGSRVFDRVSVRRDVFVLLKDLGVPAEGVADDEDLSRHGLTSMAVMTLIYTLEEHFGAAVPEERMQLANFLTVEGIVDTVMSSQK